MTPSSDTTRLADLELRELRRSLITAALFVVVMGLFAIMVSQVLLAAVLGVVVAVYLKPLQEWIAGRIGREGLAAGIALLLGLGPVLAVVVYGYSEVRDAAEYLDSHTGEVAAEIAEAAAALPVVDGIAEERIRGSVEAAGQWATSLPEALQESVAGLLVALSVFVFTAVYVQSDSDAIIDYLRSHTPRRYWRLTETLEHNARGVLHGAVYATLVTQAGKALVILALNLVFGVPLAVTLAVVAFVIGFFPVVGAWTVYVPVAGYLLVFEDSPGRAVAVLVLGFSLCTLLLSLYVRPKVAAERSRVLNFYWMFVGLVTGVYVFGVPGIVVGPLLVGLLKAVLDTVSAPESWEPGSEEAEGSDDYDEEGSDAEILTEEELDDGEE